MLRIQQQPAFVLHARRWRESSLLVEVLSRDHGRLGLAARGVNTPKRHALRAALQPLQHIRFDAVLRGELATLRQAEALDTPPRLGGTALLAGFYVNELVLRLTARQDPHPDVYAAYASVRTRLGTSDAPGWSLRRFERDLLQALGLGLDYHHDGDGVAIDPAAHYQLDPEHGARRVPAQVTRDTLGGHALIALARDVMPDTATLTALRRALRRVLAHHLGPHGLKSWELLGGLSPAAGQETAAGARPTVPPAPQSTAGLPDPASPATG